MGYFRIRVFRIVFTKVFGVIKLAFSKDSNININKTNFNKEGKKALNFQISLTIYFVAAFLLTLVVIGVVLLPAVGVFGLVMVIIASVKTSNGEDFKYPLSLNFVK